MKIYHQRKKAKKDYVTKYGTYLLVRTPTIRKDQYSKPRVEQRPTEGLLTIFDATALSQTDDEKRRLRIPHKIQSNLQEKLMHFNSNQVSESHI